MSLRCATVRAPGGPLCSARGISWHRRLAARAAAGGAGGSDGTGGGAAASATTAPPEADTVSIEYRGCSVQAPRGSTLRTALLLGGVTPHNDRAALINCRGLGTCGTCAVQVEGPVEPPAWTTAERLRLAFPPHGPPGNARLRLACQVACQGDLRVAKRGGFWGQGETVLPDLPPAAASGSGGSSGGATAPLGQLEFVLDRRRRQR